MRNFNRHIAVAGLIAGISALGLMAPRDAKGDKPSTDVSIVSPLPLPVTGTVQAQQNGNWSVGILGTPTVKIDNSGSTLPAHAFTIPPRQLSISSAGDVGSTPDPSGTRYAITSVVVSNPTGSAGEVTLSAVAFAFNATNCGFVANAVATAPGPKLTVQANNTTTITFPQPFVTAPVAGPQVCLLAGGVGFVGMTWSAVGYKILP